MDRFWNGKDSILSEGDTIEGLYIEKNGNIGVNNATIHILENETKTKIGIWGSTVLDRKLEKVPFGTEIKVVYLGRKPSEKRAGKEYHDFQVFKGVNPALD